VPFDGGLIQATTPESPANKKFAMIYRQVQQSCACIQLPRLDASIEAGCGGGGTTGLPHGGHSHVYESCTLKNKLRQIQSILYQIHIATSYVQQTTHIYSARVNVETVYCDACQTTGLCKFTSTYLVWHRCGEAVEHTHNQSFQRRASP
jgi:hypothetical protein